MYNGYQIKCGCHCANDGHSVVLEGYSDAWGTHYCSFEDDYVPTLEYSCNARTAEKVARRELIIIENGADKE